MDLVLTRKANTEKGIFGTLTGQSDEGSILLQTLEHAYSDYSGNWAPKLPRGVYTCQRGTHALKDGVPFETFEVMNVPGHSGILIHIGNYNNDSEGCILVGMSAVENMVENSKTAFEDFLAAQAGCDSFQLSVDP